MAYPIMYRPLEQPDKFFEVQRNARWARSAVIDESPSARERYTLPISDFIEDYSIKGFIRAKTFARIVGLPIVVGEIIRKAILKVEKRLIVLLENSPVLKGHIGRFNDRIGKVNVNRCDKVLERRK